MALEDAERKKDNEDPRPPEHYIREEIKLTRKVGAELLSTSADVRNAFISYMDGLLDERNTDSSDSSDT